MQIDWTAIHERLTSRINSFGVRVDSQIMGPETTGVFDGLSITTNSNCDQETQCHNLGHSFGHIAQWSLDGPRCQALYDELYAAQETKHVDPPALERALAAFRQYEEEASAYAAWLLIATDNSAAIDSFTLFARADIEAIVTYHREGVAPVWSDFFEAWQTKAARGEIEVREFVPKPIPPFTPLPLAPQEIIRAVRQGQGGG